MMPDLNELVKGIIVLATILILIALAAGVGIGAFVA